MNGLLCWAEVMNTINWKLAGDTIFVWRVERGDSYMHEKKIVCENVVPDLDYRVV